MKTLLLVDGNGLVHRAFHALPQFTTKDGTPTNAVYGFASVLHKTIADYNPTHVAVCFDTPAPTFRDKMYKKYRAQRPKAKDELKAQFPLVKEFLHSAGVYKIEHDGLEADDLIGIIATKVQPGADKIIILSADKDLLQLVNNKTLVLTPQLGYGKTKLYTTDAVINRMGVKPEQIPDLKALAGDSSDNYAGIPGIGPKTATALLAKFGSLDNIYRNLDTLSSDKARALLFTHKEKADLSKKLATILTKDHIDFPVEETEFEGYNEALHNFFERYEFRSLEARFFPKKAVAIKKVGPIDKKPDQQSLF